MAWQETLQRILSSDETFRLTIDECIELYSDAPLHQLMTAAHHRRCLHNSSNEVTYLVDRNINYTNVCTINCQFCSFYRPPGHEETYTQSYDEIHDRIHELEAIGGSRILMQGGVNPALEFSWYIDLIKALRERHPTIDLDCFSPIEIEGIAEVTELPTQIVLEHLKNAGMHGLPGGGAEMLVESVRKDVSPKKGHPDNWLRVMKEAQLLGLTTSATNVIGFGESNADRVQHLHRIREQQEEIRSLGLPGFTSFIAWPVQLEAARARQASARASAAHLIHALDVRENAFGSRHENLVPLLSQLASAHAAAQARDPIEEKGMGARIARIVHASHASHDLWVRQVWQAMHA